MDDILRSEAHFAAILYAELRQKSLCGDLLLEKIQALAGEDIGSYEISYVEPAPFRDAWKAMNNSKRLDFLRELTQKIDEDAALDGWIKKDAKGKVRSPASWTSEDKKQFLKNCGNSTGFSGPGRIFFF